MKKLIGISGNRKLLEGQTRDYLFDHYAKSVEKIGGCLFILPITENEEIVKKYIGTIDALILTGGQDIDPSLCNELPLPERETFFNLRDRFDISLIKEAIKKNIPILGICRGMQIINVYFKGSLYQDLKYISSNKIKHDQCFENKDFLHKIVIKKKSMLEKIFGLELYVNSYHHQAIKVLGNDLIATSLSTDKIIDSFEHMSKKLFILGVQWHPEILYVDNNNKNMEKLFQFFYNKIN